MMCSFANLDEKTLNEVQSLEKELGRTLIAYSCAELKPSQLEGEQLERIQKLENKLGLSLVAFDA